MRYRQILLHPIFHNHNHCMSGLQRKKFHLGKFQILNFDVVGQLLPDYYIFKYIDSSFRQSDCDFTFKPPHSALVLP